MEYVTKNGLLNHEWLSLHHDLEIDLILLDQVILNLFGLNINNNLIIDPQATNNPNSVEEYL